MARTALCCALLALCLGLLSGAADAQCAAGTFENSDVSLWLMGDGERRNEERRR